MVGKVRNQMDQYDDGRPVPLHQKMKDLKASLNIRNVKWNDWERQFIESLVVWTQSMSGKQAAIINRLWDRL